MKSRKILKPALATLLGLLLTAVGSFGQATRTWVSGVGDDANPCSRTAPGKTFAGAISKTAVGGEIDALDPGGFGTLTITKSITVNGGPGVAGVLASGVNGFNIVNSSTTTPMVVTLRNLDINGSGNGLTGINITGGLVILHVDHCQIYDFTGPGISFAASGTGSAVYITNCHIHEDSQEGIVLKPGIPAIAEIRNCTIDDCATGVHAEANATVLANNTNVSGNTGAGFESDADSVMTIENGSDNLNAIGVSSAGKVTLSNVSIADNLQVNVTHTKTGVVDSFHDNSELGIGGPKTGGPPTAYLPSH
jgi:hypothetical protein